MTFMKNVGDVYGFNNGLRAALVYKVLSISAEWQTSVCRLLEPGK
jgi:hypothetical protein